jgi:hypothetical protein
MKDIFKPLIVVLSKTGQKPGLSSHVPTYTDLCLGIVGVIAFLGLRLEIWGGVVGDVAVKPVGEHFLRDIVFEFLDLFPNVTQEGVAGPATNHHD